jgi:hypothetical protein
MEDEVGWGEIIKNIEIIIYSLKYERQKTKIICMWAVLEIINS